MLGIKQHSSSPVWLVRSFNKGRLARREVKPGAHCVRVPCEFEPILRKQSYIQMPRGASRPLPVDIRQVRCCTFELKRNVRGNRSIQDQVSSCVARVELARTLNYVE